MYPRDELKIEEIISELMQIVPENYSYDQALKLVYEYFLKLFVVGEIEENNIEYFYKEYKKALDILFNTLIRFKEFEKYVIFQSIYDDDFNEENIKYSVKKIKDELKEFEIKMYVISNSLGEYKIYKFKSFLLLFKEYFIKTNKDKLSIYKNSFIESCMDSEKDLVEKLEKGFERFFKTTLLEDKNVNTFSC